MTSDNTTYNLTLYDDAINDPRVDIATVNTSWTGIVITTVSASASLLGSAIIIFLILRSNVGLNTVYHRILFGMSVSDIIQSFPMALTTIPMPKDMIYTQFDGKAFGNTTTCSIQGFAYTTGVLCALLYNAILCIYYLCSIRFRMKDAIFRRCLEPCLHLYAIFFSVVISMLVWHYQQFNPSPVDVTWCAASRYPWWCREDAENEECSYDRGRPDRASKLFAFVNLNVLLVAGTVIIPMVVIIWHVYSQERLMRAYMAANDATARGNERRLIAYRSDVQYTKEVAFQALLYTLAFCAVWHHALIDAVANRDRRAPYEPNRAGEIAFLVLRPLQGFFNLIIFIHHKVRNFRRHRSLSFCEALKTVFDHEVADPEHIVSNLTLVNRDVGLARLHFAFADGCSINDDSDDEEEDSVDERVIISLKNKDDDVSVDGVRAFHCSPDQSVGESARDLEGFSQEDLSFGQVSVNDATTTLLHRY